MDNDQMANADTSAVAGEGRAPRQLLIGGVVALVVIGGVVAVGHQMEGSRSGAAGTTLTCKKNPLTFDRIDPYATQVGSVPTDAKYVVYKFYSPADVLNASKSAYFITANPQAKVATAPSSSTVTATFWSAGNPATQVGAAMTVNCT